MTADFTIRPTGPEDVAEVLPFVKASWARTYDPIIGEAERLRISGAKHVPSLFEAEYASAQGIGMVARDLDGKVIGHTGGELTGDGACFIDRLHIDPAWKGRGVASALMDAVATAVRDRADRLELTVLLGNERAFGFYRKYGFRDVEQLGGSHGLGGIDAVLMRCPLR